MFFTARLKLTALSVLIVASIVCGFSIFIYRNIEQNLKDASEEDFAGIEFHRHFLEHTLGIVQNDLLLADTVILIAAVGLSFMLAGKTLKPIQLSLEAQKAFAANASHELRTPLAVMRNDIEVYLRNTSPTKERTEGTLKSNLEEIKRMSSIVEDLLVLARSDTRALSRHEAVDVSAVVTTVVERMKSIARNKQIQLSHTPASPILVHGAEGPLERVLLNILQNSIGHTPIGGSIDVTIEKEESQVLLRITDTGSGIPAKDLPHIFTRFYKGNSATGTGLGLSIVKEVVDQHRGEIEVQSVVGTGTTVTIRLPSA